MLWWNHTLSKCIRKGEEYHEKEKYILSTSLLISLTSNPVLSMAGEWVDLDQEIASVQENQTNNSNQNDKNQESGSQDISDSKDQDAESSSDTPDKSEEDSDSGDKKSDQDKGSDESGKESDVDNLDKDHKQDDPESEPDKDKDSTDSDKSDKEDDKDSVKEDSSEKNENVSDSDSTDQEKKDTENEDKTGEKQEDGLETSSGKSDSSSESKKEEEEADTECAQLEGCVDGKHDKDCPLYTEEVDLIQDAECAHLEGCVDGKHDQDCPLYEIISEIPECAHLEGCVGDVHDKDCPLYEEIVPALFAAKNSENSYEVSTTEELKEALEEIEKNEAEEAVIVLTANVSVPIENDVSSFGVDEKHITVESEEGNLYELNFSNLAMLTGSCTFENVDVRGYELYCNGYQTVFSKDGEIHLTGTLYGGGYREDVDSTYVIVAATGWINPYSASSGLHNVIGGSYQASVKGDTYLEITGDIQFTGGNLITPGCVMGDGTSGDQNNSPDVSVGGTSTLIYDNQNAKTSPSIVGTCGCEMNGNVILDVRSGETNEICGNYEFPEKSIICKDLHIIAGAKEYEDTDRTLRLGGNWPITGAGNLFAGSPSLTGTYTVEGSVTIDTYENVWGWDKGTEPSSYDIPDIYGAICSNVGGDITINAHGSHMENITGAESSTVQGSVTINAINVELKNSNYETEDDWGDIYGLKGRSTAQKAVTIKVNGGDINMIMDTDQEEVPTGSEINITRSPKIRTGVLGTTNYSVAPAKAPTVNLTACTATIPFIQSAATVNVIDHSSVTLSKGLWLARNLNVEEDSYLGTYDLDVSELEGNATVNGTWEQFYDANGTPYDCTIDEKLYVGENGTYISHGTMNVVGTVENGGVIALMKPAQFDSDYIGKEGELRLPVVSENNYSGTAACKIPLRIMGISSGKTTVNTVVSSDWNTLQTPSLGDNYIVSKKSGDDPAQNTFLLGNEDALEQDLFLKRVNDPGNISGNYMWQVATGITVIFDKNGGDTEASPRIISQDKMAGSVNHVSLPTTEPTKSGCKFIGWNTKADGSGDSFTEATNVTSSMRVYAQWESGYVSIVPMDITVYVGGEGYSGVIGDNGFFSGNDLPEIGFYLILPDDMNALLGSSEEKQVDLSGIFSLTYYDTGDAGHTTRDWELELYGDESMNHVTVNGQHVFIYKLMPSKINGTEEKIPLRMQFTDKDGNVMTDSKFPVNTGDEYRDYTINFYPGELNENELRATFHVNGTTVSRKIHLGSGKLRVRGNMDESYRDISNTAPSVNPQRPGLFLAQTAQNNTDYYLNDTGIRVQASGVKLLVDHSLNDALLRKYIESTSNAEGKYSYQFRYLDLVDTNNGNAYVTMGAGQKMKIYWPVPADAKADTEFHIVHFVGLDRDADVDMSDLWTTHIPEEMKGKKVTIDGHSFVEFSVSSFSPFALLYEKDGTATTNPDPAPSHSSSSGHGSSSGRGSTTSSGVVIETGTQETKTPDQANALPAGTIENMLEEENTESALPKTGQEWNQSALVFFSSILRFKEKRKLDDI